MKAIVVGAGISGLIASKELSSLGANVYLIEEHKKIGLPTHCGGLVAPNFWQKLGIPKKKNLVLNEYSGISFSDGHHTFTLRTRKPFLFAISRILLDQYVGDLAEKKGTKILAGERIKKVFLYKGGVKALSSSGNVFESDVAFIADGLFGQISNKIFPKKGKSLLLASQAVFRHSLEPSFPLVLLRKDFSEDFFAYIAPLNDEFARVGVASAKPIASLVIKKLVKAYNLKQVEPSKHWGIWIGGPTSKVSFYDKLFLLGDAAGFTKATTGGGIVFGSILSRLLSKYVASSNEAEKKLAKERVNYLKKNLEFMLLIRKTLNFFGPSFYYPLLNKIANLRGIEKVVETLDYDFLFDTSLFS
ncbi:MAG: NAD(P)/FAD-dependent oxidoreductase [Candidatus Brockarchaeota archaeon]|nr:NAD(P)/FAD-dependent oxidoreductase [Candidatus Brockarchaeota archaeon]MBO3768090.1 NAD(P)/FAD-dependent oxidoreductase [Candidatus Brockarchaeota archaeon]